MKNLKFLAILLLFVALGACKQKETVEEMKLPTDKKATQETVELYNFLFDSMEKGKLVGHQDDLAYGHGWYGEPGRSDVKDITGNYPAVVGWELGHLEIAADFNLDSIYFSDMKRYIKETYQRGGITTASWHGDNIVTGNTSWDCDQDSVVTTILEGGSNHAEYIVWLDRLADFFLDLKDENGTLIPVVFRMYHEHTGAWFWWGSKQCTPEEYKQLWVMTVEYLRDVKGVHNLLYCYSPTETNNLEHYLERYPGDEYVDMLAFDSYVYGDDKKEAVEKYRKVMPQNLDIITQYAETSGKIPVIGETGFESVLDTTYFTEILYPIIKPYKIAWVLFWRNAWEPDKPHHFYLPYKGHAAEADFVKFVSMEDIFLNEQ